MIQSCENCGRCKEDPKEIDGTHDNECTYALVPSHLRHESRYLQEGWAYLSVGLTSFLKDKGLKCQVWEAKNENNE